MNLLTLLVLCKLLIEQNLKANQMWISWKILTLQYFLDFNVHIHSDNLYKIQISVFFYLVTMIFSNSSKMQAYEGILKSFWLNQKRIYSFGQIEKCQTELFSIHLYCANTSHLKEILSSFITGLVFYDSNKLWLFHISGLNWYFNIKFDFQAM